MHYFIPLIMSGEKIAMRVIFTLPVKKKKGQNEERPGTVNDFMAQNWFRRCDEGDTIIEDKDQEDLLL